MKTIAQQLKVTDFPFTIEDKNGKRIYHENSDGVWIKKEFDSKGNIIYYEDSNGFWYKKEHDSNGREIYYESSTGFWYKKEYDSKGIRIYCENSDGYIEDNRPKSEVQKALELLTSEGMLVDGKILKS